MILYTCKGGKWLYDHNLSFGAWNFELHEEYAKGGWIEEGFSFEVNDSKQHYDGNKKDYRIEPEDVKELKRVF